MPTCTGEDEHVTTAVAGLTEFLGEYLAGQPPAVPATVRPCGGQPSGSGWGGGDASPAWAGGSISRS
jgi:hypothetical protein